MRIIAIAATATLLTACTVPANMPVSETAQAPVRSALLARSGIIALDETNSLLAFGTDLSQVQRRLSPLLGPVVLQLVNEDCSAGALTFDEYEDLTLVSDGEVLLGWTTHSASLRTDAGIGLGSTEQELNTAYTTEIHSDSTGRTFAAEGFYGTIEAGVIVDMWAGTSCTFR